jgi:nitrate reductase molybdenum cofactor assembly chaperone NarJ/NarW
MKLLKLIAVLLEYPHAELWQHPEELREACAESSSNKTCHAGLRIFLDELLAKEPMTAQEEWLALFDRGRAMSLLLFEHIHGESRDRGQAMVDLVSTYHKAGFELSAKQLPDYLPVVLEYLSLRPEQEWRDWLAHIASILELLAARAQQRESSYAALFEILVEQAKGQVELESLRGRVANEERDDTAEAMDKVWEEEVVRFGAEANANSCQSTPRPPLSAKSIELKVVP